MSPPPLCSSDPSVLATRRSCREPSVRVASAGSLARIVLLGLVLVAPLAPAADVTGYSIMKGEFLLQTGPGLDDLVRDPDFGFSVLATVELEDFDLLTSARLRLPAGDSQDLEDYGDSWSILDSHETAADLDEAYPWGDYVMIFDAPGDGRFSCLVGMPETALPPRPRLVNFADMQAVDAGRPLTLTWEFDGGTAEDDFIQVYVNLGHGEVFATPNLGEPGALRSTDRTVTLPAGVLFPGAIHSLNLEITRIVSTNAACHPSAQGVGAVFRSTEVDVFVYPPPTLRWLPRPTQALPDLEVVADPEQTVVLQRSEDLGRWSDVATSTAASGTNVFPIPPDSGPSRFFRAVIR